MACELSDDAPEEGGWEGAIDQWWKGGQERRVVTGFKTAWWRKDRRDLQAAHQELRQRKVGRMARPSVNTQKAAIHENLKSGHTFRRNVLDMDSSGRVSSFSQYPRTPCAP